MGTILIVGLLLFIVGRHMGKRSVECGCESSSPRFGSASKVESGTNMGVPKYESPRGSQENVVVRKSIALLTTRGR